ncbi:MAG: sulfite exporter TauE/SafE family protein [Planctomycetota bacterium]|jgi:uncharacterized membrane protein YfcA
MEWGIYVDGLEITYWWQWAALLVGGFLIGVAKTGLPGVGILVVPLLAMAFGGKPSVGLLLPILIFADIFAVTYYRRHGEWKHLMKLLPWALVGVGIGFFVLKMIDSEQLKPVIGAIVLVMLGLRFQTLLGKDKDSDHVSHNRLFAATMGTAAGVTTMMANAAGPVMTLYLLSMGFDKKKFIGTAAWFFFIVNWIKVPLMGGLGMITLESLKLDLVAFPAVAVGAFAGIWLLKRIPQKLFNMIALALAAAAAVKLLF